MSNTSSTSSGGIGFGGALCLLFIFLKLTDHIAWSWWWVLAPIWIPLAIVAAILSVLGVAWLFDERAKRRRRKARGW